MPETWAVPLIVLLLGIIGTLGGWLWHAKHKHADERETNWRESRSEIIKRLDKITEALTIVVELNGRVKRTEDDIQAYTLWRDKRANPCIEIMPQHELRIGALERLRNGKIPP